MNPCIQNIWMYVNVFKMLMGGRCSMRNPSCPRLYAYRPYTLKQTVDGNRLQMNQPECTWKKGKKDAVETCSGNQKSQRNPNTQRGCKESVKEWGSTGAILYSCAHSKYLSNKPALAEANEWWMQHRFKALTSAMLDFFRIVFQGRGCLNKGRVLHPAWLWSGPCIPKLS